MKQENHMYTFESKIRYSETDKTGKLPIPGILNYFQDCSVFQSEELGVGVEYLASKKRAWILNSWQLVVNRLPKECELVRTSTWASGFEKIHGTRNFIMQDQHGKLIAYANSIWVYIDLETARPVQPSQDEVALYHLEPPFQMKYLPRKVKAAKEWIDCPPVRVKPDWIDSNHHVNNNRYIKAAYNELPEGMDIYQVRVEYKKQAVLGDLLIPRISMEEKRTVVAICDTNGTTYALVEFQERQQGGK